MIGYSEVLQTMAAMIIFSMILMNANHLIHRNTVFQISGELEQEVIALGQEIIEEARSKSYDQVVHGSAVPPTIIPEGFTPADQLGPDYPDNYENGEPSRHLFTDFDDYNAFSDTLSTTHGEFIVNVEVFYVDDTNFERIESPSTFKKIEVSVTSEFLRSGNTPREYKLEFIRNYYAD